MSEQPLREAAAAQAFRDPLAARILWETRGIRWEDTSLTQREDARAALNAVDEAIRADERERVTTTIEAHLDGRTNDEYVRVGSIYGWLAAVRRLGDTP